MAEAAYSENHLIDPDTGFVENPAYATAFDSKKKILFLQRLKQNNMRLYKTARELGMSLSTVHKHYNTDAVFKKAFEAIETEYTDELEGVSRENALNPRSVIERIFQLKSLRPEKYGDEKIHSVPNITINFDANLLAKMNEKAQAIDVKSIAGTLDQKPKIIDAETF
jgi:hypothetical protein